MLKTGMYWGYTGKLTEGEIRSAIAHYRRHHPGIVNAIYLRPSEIGDFYTIDGLPIRPDPTVIRQHLFLAVQ